MASTSPAGRPTRRIREGRANDAELFRLLVERVVDYAIFLLTPEGRVASWNSGAERLKRYTADEIIGQSFERFYAPEDRAAGKPKRLLAKAREDGRVEDEGWRYRSDGTAFWADVVITALRDDSGELLGYAKVTRDLTQRRAAEDQLRQSEARFRTLVDSIADYAIFLLSTDGIVQTWNEGAQRLKGYTPEEIIGRSFETFYPPEGRAEGRPARLLAIARKEGRVEDEGYRVRKDGSRFWADVVITALRDGAGELTGYAKITRDLTDRRDAEQERTRRMAAERSAERFERLQAATAALAAASRQQHVAQIVTDTAVRSVSASGGMVAFVSADGASLDIAAARDFGVITPVVQRAWHESRSVFTDGQEGQAAVPLIFERRVLGVVAVRFDPPRAIDADERAFLLALTEVAAQAMDRARLYESEHAARAEAEAAVRAQDEFLSIASHELRTPVAAVKATAQLAERAIERNQVDTARLTRHLRMIARAADRLNALVEDLLDVSRLKTGQLQLRLEAFDPVPLAREILTRYASASDGHRFDLDAPDIPPLGVIADPLRIEQVLDNLLSNAVKYSPGGGDIKVHITPDEDGVTFSVTDTGIGLPAGQETRIFETFGRASNAAGQQIPGLGLGLSICKQLIERHRGRIWASSPGEGKGTTLAFWIPTDAHA